MYELSDTIVAVSSPPSNGRVLIRVTGKRTIQVCSELLVCDFTKEPQGVYPSKIKINGNIHIDVIVYLFLGPRSYTGEDVAEIHATTNSSVVEQVMVWLFNKGLRMAGPGEFTARAYLNGKIDLAQAEAVNEIITTSNTYQLEVAQKLLGGRLAEATGEIRSEIVDMLSNIELGMDFSGEDVEFITQEEGAARIEKIKEQLQALLAGRISYEKVIELASVGIAGAPNAGKSSLLNRLLAKERSIISAKRKTTRDVLTGVLSLSHTESVLFDCAGLITKTRNILDELAQEAAIDALNSASVVILCVDVTKKNLNEDLVIRRLFSPAELISVAAKADLLPVDELKNRIEKLNSIFGVEFLACSSKTNLNLEELKERIDKKIIELKTGIAAAGVGGSYEQEGVALTARHRDSVLKCIDNIENAMSEFTAGNDELAAMSLRIAHREITELEQQSVDEQILDKIFSNFCIGK